MLVIQLHNRGEVAVTTLFGFHLDLLQFPELEDVKSTSREPKVHGRVDRPYVGPVLAGSPILSAYLGF